MNPTMFGKVIYEPLHVLICIVHYILRKKYMLVTVHKVPSDAGMLIVLATTHPHAVVVRNKNSIIRKRQSANRCFDLRSLSTQPFRFSGEAVETQIAHTEQITARDIRLHMSREPLVTLSFPPTAVELYKRYTALSSRLSVRMTQRAAGKYNGSVRPYKNTSKI